MNIDNQIKQIESDLKKIYPVYLLYKILVVICFVMSKINYGLLYLSGYLKNIEYYLNKKKKG